MAFGLVATAAVWWLALRIRAGAKVALLDPVLLSVAALIALLLGFDIPYAHYDRGGRVLRFLLDPAVVALAIPLYRQRAHLRRHLLAIVAGVTAGSIVGIVSAYGLVRLFGGSQLSALSLVPKSVTTPIAIGIAEATGGVVPLTIFSVVCTGLLGGTLGPDLGRLFGVRSRLAIGLATGASSHGIGTARALRDHPFEGAMSGIAMTLTGLVTALIAPLLLGVILAIEHCAAR